MDCLLQKGQWSAVAIISYQCKYLEYFNLNPETKVGSRLFDNFFRRWTKTLRLKTLNDIIHPWMNKRQTQTCCKMKRNKKEIRDWLSTCNWDSSQGRHWPTLAGMARVETPVFLAHLISFFGHFPPVFCPYVTGFCPLCHLFLKYLNPQVWQLPSLPYWCRRPWRIQH